MVLSHGERNYESSFQNGIQSVAKGGTKNGVSIFFREAPSVIRIECDESARSGRFSGTVGTKFTVFCAKGCSKGDQNVFGDGIYTDYSAICQAAVHYGLMTDKGGEIQFMIEEGQKMYTGIEKNGITSERRGNYLRSFRSLGDRNNVCPYFKERYLPANIFENWKIIDSNGARLGPFNWNFNSHPSHYGLAIRQNF